VPDFLIRRGIRRLLGDRLRQEVDHSADLWAEQCRHGPIAIETAAANAQHYEVPSKFFESILGPRLKYSACLFESPSTDLAAAETAMLELASSRAELQDGQSILELGCGWGSWALWMAERFPRSEIAAVSNSRTQKAFIDSRIRERGLRNLEVTTCDMNSFATDRSFDRVVSVEMFEHMHNHRELLRRVRSWLRSSGKAFLHVFCHKTLAYPFETDGADNWMGRHFFSGGMMPSFDWFSRFADDLVVEQQWAVNGTHYSRTLEAWLENLDRRRGELKRLFPAEDAARMLQRWRIFLMASSELFAFRGGEEWFVGHYRFTPK
jgi:cyclopropane-fatty-acyl-phospholipid synthase